ncbi:MAG: YbjN domain-containing protein [Cyanobacteria bacterium J06632_19]
MTSYPSGSENDETMDDLIPETESINHVEVIEQVIGTLDENNTAMVSQPHEGAYLWKFKYGSVEVFVQLTGTSDDDMITVWSSVLKLPAKDEPTMMRSLLQMNCSATLEARFGIIEDQVVVISKRTLEDLSAAEVSRLITIVATIADDNDEDLQSKYGK